jgi:hypothetical protein
MTHHASLEFWAAYDELPSEARSVADKSFALLKSNPQHPSIRLKKVGNYWSARVGRRHRALAMEVHDGFLWFWIGTHEEYDRLVGS